jgi:signal transduction histidine kinase
VTLDFTDRKRLEAERRQLAQHLHRAQRQEEQEREQRLMADRDRIGRDLHDIVIRQMFATGLELQSAVGRAADNEMRTRLAAAIDGIDEAIRQVRAIVFDIESRRPNAVSAAVQALTREAGATLGFEPVVTFRGAVDDLIPDEVAAALLATLRESLANIARHAAATSVSIEVGVGDEITMTVHDDGVGLSHNGSGAQADGAGLTSMRAHAERFGGRFDARSTSGGTNVSWRVPVPRVSDEETVGSA